jgi:sortase (surface protein transpeptidase)
MVRRALPAVLVAALVAALVVAGCGSGPSATPGPPTPSPAPTPTVRPTPTPVVPAASQGPYYPLPSPDLTPRPTATPSPAPASGKAGRPTRVAVPSLRIDLPVVVPPRSSTWPLCDVAEYFRPPTFQHPGAGGVTYIYGHAQKGMFLPILTASRRSGGRAMIGDKVTVWTANNHRYTYRITQVRRFQKTLTWALALPPNALVLQTSEDQYRAGTKVMLVARQVGDPVIVPEAEAQPRAKPRVCGR